MDSKSLALIATLVLAATMTMNTNSSTEWDSYKSFHGKTYATAEEDSYRLAMFMNAKAEAVLHNADNS